MNRRCAAAFLVLVPMAGLPLDSLAQTPETAVSPLSNARVRGADREATRLLEAALACSASMARTMEALESSGLILTYRVPPAAATSRSSPSGRQRVARGPIGFGDEVRCSRISIRFTSIPFDSD